MAAQRLHGACMLERDNMAKKDYTSEPWWGALTEKERQEIMRRAPEEEMELESNEEQKPKKKPFKYHRLFGYG